MDIKNSPEKKDREIRSPISGSPKKGGAGGKGTWGVGGWDDLKTTKTDRSDPNYLSDNEDLVLQKTDIVSPIESIMTDYFSAGENHCEEVAKSILEYPTGPAQFLKDSLVLAMDLQAYEREMVSKLLLKLYNAPLTTELIQAGFQRVLDDLPDISIDAPEASELLGKFIARAILDEVVPPIFIQNAEVNNPKAAASLNLAHGLSTDVFRFEKLAHVWGPGDGTSVKRLEKEVRFTIKEYLSSKDGNEAIRSIREMNSPHFHFHVVEFALQIGITRSEDDLKSIFTLLKAFKDTGLVSELNFIQGTQNCAKSLDDLKLDAPKAPEYFQSIIQQGLKDEWLPAGFTMV